MHTSLEEHSSLEEQPGVGVSAVEYTDRGGELEKWMTLKVRRG